MVSPRARSRSCFADFAAVWPELFAAEQARIVAAPVGVAEQINVVIAGASGS